MDKIAKVRRIALIVIGAVAVLMVGAFAIVSDQTVESENVARGLEVGPAIGFSPDLHHHRVIRPGRAHSAGGSG